VNGEIAKQDLSAIYEDDHARAAVLRVVGGRRKAWSPQDNKEVGGSDNWAESSGKAGRCVAHARPAFCLLGTAAAPVVKVLLLISF
jgi:hypothetical protein